MKTRLLLLVFLGLPACKNQSHPAPPSPLPPGHPVAEDTTPKEAPRKLAAEDYIRSFLSIFGGLDPAKFQQTMVSSDGAKLFDYWDAYLGTLGLPDYRVDIPRLSQTNALMVATFERIGIALCDRALEHDRKSTPRLVYDFDLPDGELTLAQFSPRFDVLHRTFLSYPAALAPTDRVNRYFKLYSDTVAAHAQGAKTAFTPTEAGWAAVCYGLVRHPEFQLY